MNGGNGHGENDGHGHGHGYGHSSGSGSGAWHEPSEERGRASWSAPEPGSLPSPSPSSPSPSPSSSPPSWASAETQTSRFLPPWPAPAAAPPPHRPVAPAPAAPHGVRRLLAALTATVVLGTAAGGGFWYVTRDHTGAPHTVAGARASGGATPASGAAASPSAAGYRTARDPVGYTVEVPRGWTRRERQGQKAPLVSYTSPRDGRRLQIFRVSEATPAASLDLAERDPGYGFARRPGFRPLGRAHGPTWAELTYRYDDGDHGARQVVDHRFAAPDGTLYAIRASGPESLPAALVRGPLVTAVGSFCPADTHCP
ncbi:hypothetical protein [Streptomyces sp. NPDC005423]|uniref:hypothetical protein n=1 Tax=Streptomyces sp. NPDC005423 TaxID=3155343 RepID=UPI0033AF2F24